MILVIGANSSGKSSYAEDLITSRPGPRTYIATMICRNEENKVRIRKHIDKRAGKGFVTIEEPYDLLSPTLQEEITDEHTVLLEDLSNLIANNLFEKDDREVLPAILDLAQRAKELVIVTIGGMDSSEYDGETADYIDLVNTTNDRLAELADTVIRMENGTPTILKGTI